MADPKVLVADDDEGLCYLLREQLTGNSFQVDTVHSGSAALERINSNIYDAVLLDLHMKDISGEEILRTVRASYPSLPVIILTGETEIQKAIECIKAGAYDYKTKPYNADDLLLTIQKAIQHHDLVIKTELLEKKTSTGNTMRIIGNSPALKAVLLLAEKAARSESNVLVEGETGTGKELFAEYIHRMSQRQHKNFVAVNCASLPDQLIESELFGYEKGAFTDAKAAKQGLVEIANGGTLFLDEIGEMSMNIQPKLLRFLENGEYRRIGGLHSLTSDVRVIGATNRNLYEEAEQKRFRQDLLFRLNVITLTIPPLREREGDILLLADYFLQKKSPIRSPKVLSPAARQRLLEYHFPGNVRELEHIIERAIIFSDGPQLMPEDLFLPAVQSKNAETRRPATAPELKSIDELEKEHIMYTLEKNQWERNRSAAELGISVKTLYTKIKKYGLKENAR